MCVEPVHKRAYTVHFKSQAPCLHTCTHAHPQTSTLKYVSTEILYLYLQEQTIQNDKTIINFVESSAGISEMAEVDTRIAHVGHIGKVCGGSVQNETQGAALLAMLMRSTF